MEKETIEYRIKIETLQNGVKKHYPQVRISKHSWFGLGSKVYELRFDRTSFLGIESFIVPEICGISFAD
jgi:hypothetical protein